MSHLKRLVIFDRDGTIIEHVHHLHRIEDVHIAEGAIDALIELKQVGFSFGIATNQSVISLGLATSREVDEINNWIIHLFHKEGIDFDFVRVCPHQASSNCLCRKPKTGMVEDIFMAEKYNLAESFMVGDSLSDVYFGQRLGLKSILIDKQSSNIDFGFSKVQSIDQVSRLIIRSLLR